MVRSWKLRSILFLVAALASFALAERYGAAPAGPVPVAVSDRAVAAMQPGSFAAGWHHALVVLQDGTVWAWGRNDRGQLGDGSDDDRPTPAQVMGLMGVRSVAAGTSHSLALLEDGTVWAWGRNDAYQLGHASREDQWAPVQVEGIAGARAIAAGGQFSAAILDDGSLWTWGSQSGGQLGVVMLDVFRSMPVQVEAVSGVRSVATGEIFTLALLDDGSVWGWGRNQSGQVGTGESMNQYNRPVLIEGLADVVHLAAGQEHALAVTADGDVWGWGFHEFGQLGIDAGGEWRLATPTRLDGLQGDLSVAAGSDHSFALDANGQLWAWGRHDFGRLGDGSTEHRFAPVEITGLSDVVGVDGGHLFSIAVTADGAVWTWGDNRYGQLGDGTVGGNRPLPGPVDGLGAVRLAAVDGGLALH